MKIFKFSLIAASFLLIGCGGGGGGSSSKKVEGFSDISGMWNTTTKENGLEDVAYAYIDNNGKVTIYDYLNDSYDKGADCYDIGVGTITHNNQDRFTGEDGKSFTAKIENNILILTYPDHLEKYTKVTDFTKTSLDSLSCENYGNSTLNTSAVIMKEKDAISIVYNYSKNICESQALKDRLIASLGARNIILSSESNDVDCTTYDRTDNGSTCAENRDSTAYSVDTSCVIGADIPASSKVNNKPYSLQFIQKGIKELFTK